MTELKKCIQDLKEDGITLKTLVQIIKELYKGL